MEKKEQKTIWVFKDDDKYLKKLKEKHLLKSKAVLIKKIIKLLKYHKLENELF